MAEQNQTVLPREVTREAFDKAVEAFRAGAKARTQVMRDEALRLRFGILLYEGDAPPDIVREYESFARDAGGN